MRYRTLGRLADGTPGPRVSALCLGALPFGSTVGPAASYAVLDRFVERGGTFVDTANCYSFWVDGASGDESELLLGRWLAERGTRDDLVLSTKVGAHPAGPGPWPESAEGLAAEVVRRGVEGSLERLGTDRVELLYGHLDDRATPLEETVDAFGALVRDGIAGQVGISNQLTWRLERSRALARARGVAGYTCIQQRHSYLRPAAGTDFGTQQHVTPELLDYARAEPDLTLLAYTPLLSGAYTDPAKPLLPQYRHAGAAAQLAVLREVAAETAATAGQVVLAWLMGGELPVLPVIGASSVAQLDESLDAVELELTPEQRQRLDEA
ncbi:aldo/keto reductase [Kitasatospora sp. NBC_00315]|uniref:aldo/keto reductase n=1 Tax=Kitasatospora sp. NBC_00315 TaxID=2975963 RepID=UPI00324CF416